MAGASIDFASDAAEQGVPGGANGAFDGAGGGGSGSRSADSDELPVSIGGGGQPSVAGSGAAAASEFQAQRGPTGGEGYGAAARRRRESRRAAEMDRYRSEEVAAAQTAAGKRAAEAAAAAESAFSAAVGVGSGAGVPAVRSGGIGRAPAPQLRTGGMRSGSIRSGGLAKGLPHTNSVGTGGRGVPVSGPQPLHGTGGRQRGRSDSNGPETDGSSPHLREHGSGARLIATPPPKGRHMTLPQSPRARFASDPTDVNPLSLTNGVGSSGGIARAPAAELAVVAGAPRPDPYQRRPQSEGVLLNLAGVTTALEALELSIADVFGLSTSEAAALMANGAQYLSRVLVGGMRGSFASVIALCRALHAHAGAVARLMLAHPADIPVVLSALRPGMLSRSQDTAKIVCRLVAALGLELLEGGQGDAAWEWFISRTGALSACVGCLRRHPGAREHVFDALSSMGGKHLDGALGPHLRAVVLSATEYLRFCHEMVPLLAQSRTKEAAIAQGVVPMLADAALRSTEPACPVPERSTAYSLLCEIWITFTEAVEAVPETSAALMRAFKRGARDPDFEVQVLALSSLFHMAEAFADGSTSPYSPVMYKTLIFALIENVRHEAARDFLVDNMVTLLRRLEVAPVGVLLEPLVKQVAVYGYSNKDFDLFVEISKHPRLALRPALRLMDLLGKVCLHDPVFSRLGSVPLLAVMQRFHSEAVVCEYVRRFCTVALEMFVRVELSRAEFSKVDTAGAAAKPQASATISKDGTVVPVKGTRPDSPSAKGGAGTVPVVRSRTARDTIRVKRVMVLETLGKLLHLRRSDIHVGLTEVFVKGSDAYAEAHNGEHHPALLALVELCRRNDAAAQRAKRDERVLSSGTEKTSGSARRSRGRLLSAGTANSSGFFPKDEDSGHAMVRRPTGNSRPSSAKRPSPLRRETRTPRRRMSRKEVEADDQEARVLDSDGIEEDIASLEAEAKEGREDGDNDSKSTTSHDRDSPTASEGAEEMKDVGSPPGARKPSVRNRRGTTVGGKKQEDALKAGSKLPVPSGMADALGRQSVSPTPFEAVSPSTIDDDDATERTSRVHKKQSLKKSSSHLARANSEIDSIRAKVYARKAREEAEREEQEKREERVKRQLRTKLEREHSLRQDPESPVRQQRIASKGRGRKRSSSTAADAVGDATLLARAGYLHGADVVALERLATRVLRPWRRALKGCFSRYAEKGSGGPSAGRAVSFDVVKKEKGNIALPQWLRFCRDFGLVPTMVKQSEATQIFHRCNLRIGDGVVRPLCSFAEFLSTVRVLARSFEPDNEIVATDAAGLPDDEAGHAEALIAYLRNSARHAYGRDPHCLQGNPAAWEARRNDGTASDVPRSVSPRPGRGRTGAGGVVLEAAPPAIGHEFDVPSSLELKESLCAALEVLDVVMMRAVGVHLLLRQVPLPAEVDSLPSMSVPSTRPTDSVSVDGGSPVIIKRGRRHTRPRARGTASGSSSPTRDVQDRHEPRGRAASDLSNRSQTHGGPPGVGSPLPSGAQFRFGGAVVYSFPRQTRRAAEFVVGILRDLADSVSVGDARDRLLDKYHHDTEHPQSLKSWRLRTAHRRNRQRAKRAKKREIAAARRRSLSGVPSVVRDAFDDDEPPAPATRSLSPDSALRSQFGKPTKAMLSRGRAEKMSEKLKREREEAERRARAVEDARRRRQSALQAKLEREAKVRQEKEDVRRAELRRRTEEDAELEKKKAERMRKREAKKRKELADFARKRAEARKAEEEAAKKREEEERAARLARVKRYRSKQAAQRQTTSVRSTSFSHAPPPASGNVDDLSVSDVSSVASSDDEMDAKVAAEGKAVGDTDGDGEMESKAGAVEGADAEAIAVREAAKAARKAARKEEKLRQKKERAAKARAARAARKPKESLYDRMRRKEAEKNARMEAERQAKLKAELDACTFQPDIVTSQSLTPAKSGRVKIRTGVNDASESDSQSAGGDAAAAAEDPPTPTQEAEEKEEPGPSATDFLSEPFGDQARRKSEHSQREERMRTARRESAQRKKSTPRERTPRSTPREAEEVQSAHTETAAVVDDDGEYAFIPGVGEDESALAVSSAAVEENGGYADPYSGWEQHYSEEHEAYYFFHPEAGTTTWEQPLEFVGEGEEPSEEQVAQAAAVLEAAKAQQDARAAQNGEHGASDDAAVAAENA